MIKMVSKINILKVLNYSITVILVACGLIGIFITGLKANLIHQIMFLVIAAPIYILSVKNHVKYSETTFSVGYLFGIIATFVG